MANIIKEIKIKNLQPVIWYGQNVIDKYTSIAKVIGSQLGPNYANLFSQPQLTDSSIKGKSVAIWLSNKFTSQSIPLTELDKENYSKAKEVLNEKIGAVLGFANKLLLSEKDENVKWGQLILKAIIYPDESFVLYEQGDITIYAWGFELVDSSQAISGYSKEISNNNNKTDEIEKSIIHQDLKNNNVETENEESKDNVADYNRSINEVVRNEKTETTHNEDELNLNEEHEKFEDVNEEKDLVSKSDSSYFKRYWWLFLLFLLLMLSLLSYILLKNDNPIDSGDTNTEIGQVIPPINPVDIITSPDSLTSIVSDRLNIALHGDNKDIDESEIDQMDLEVS